MEMIRYKRAFDILIKLSNKPRKSFTVDDNNNAFKFAKLILAMGPTIDNYNKAREIIEARYRTKVELDENGEPIVDSEGRVTITKDYIGPFNAELNALALEEVTIPDIKLDYNFIVNNYDVETSEFVAIMDFIEDLT